VLGTLPGPVDYGTLVGMLRTQVSRGRVSRWQWVSLRDDHRPGDAGESSHAIIEPAN